jgi:hypothetical protein
MAKKNDGKSGTPKKVPKKKEKRIHKRVKCNQCDKEMSQSHIKAHMDTHMGEDDKKVDTQCHICSKLIKHDNFWRHMKIHNQIYTYLLGKSSEPDLIFQITAERAPGIIQYDWIEGRTDIMDENP